MSNKARESCGWDLEDGVQRREIGLRPVSGVEGSRMDVSCVPLTPMLSHQVGTHVMSDSEAYTQSTTPRA